LAKIGVKRALRLAGHSLCSSDYLHKYCFGFHLAELFEKHGIECVIDVGAHLGGYRDFLRNEVGFKGRVLSFEPVQRHIDVLRQRARRDPKWSIHGFALGAQSGCRQMNVMRQSVFSSFLNPDDSKVRDFSVLNRIEHQEEVRMETLDSVLDELKAQAGLGPAFLKIDTQGYDWQVIQGAQRSLPNIVALQTELAVRPLYHDVPVFTEVCPRLRELGFDLTGFYPVARDSDLRLVEVDCVMVNRRFLCPGTGAPHSDAAP
jgi:FkbM family methyltransferase